MIPFLSWDRNDHFASDHRISGISVKTVQFCKDNVDIGFTSYPIGELFCQFLNYDPSPFWELYKRRERRFSIPYEELAAVLSAMPYYGDLMAQMTQAEQVHCAQLFSLYQRGALWVDAADCIRLLENRYYNLSIQMSKVCKTGQHLVSALSSLSADALNSPSLGYSLREPIPKPIPVLAIRNSNTEPEIVEQYRLSHLSELLYLDMIYLLRSEMHIQRCQHCNRYYLPERGYNYRYCTRVAPGETNRSCREVGAAKTRQRKLEKSGILAEYQRAYTRYYARIHKQIWSREQFHDWQTAALALQAEAQRDHWTDQQYADRLREIAFQLECI